MSPPYDVSDALALALAAALALLLWRGRERRQREAEIASALDLGEPRVVLDGRGTVIDANVAAFALFDVKGRDRPALKAQLLGVPALRSLLEDPARECGEFFAGASAATRRCYEVRAVRAAGKPGGVRVFSMHDVTAQRESEHALYHQAHFDSLTGLPNRRYSHKHLERTLDEARRSGERLALVYADLDRFKAINDCHGHAAGDQLLRIVAHRLRQHLRADDRSGGRGSTLARVGGDEFVAVVPCPGGEAEAARIAERLLGVLAEPVALEGRTLWNAGSVGIALYPEHGEDVHGLMRAADAALYDAKSQCRGSYRFFRPELTQATQRKASIDHQLRRAIAANELELHFQPKYSLRGDGALVGAEALLRWNSAELGRVGPGEFVPVAEEFGLIAAIGHWVIEQVCAHLAAWRDEGLGLVPVSVNVSPIQLVQSQVAQQVAEALRRREIEPRLLEIELTESSILEDEQQAMETLRQLRSFGVRISLDDFGTGYSSLSYLNRVPLDVLKLDRQFLRDLHLDPSAEEMLSALIAMAHSLKLEVVAEGVDCAEQLPILSRIGCDLVQGFVSGAPLPAREFRELLATSAASSRPERVLVVGDGRGSLGLLAMRLSRIGIAAVFASGLDEALLFAAEPGGPVRAVLVAPGPAEERLLPLMKRLRERLGEAPSLVFVGDGKPDKPLLELRSCCRLWAVREPIDDPLLRQLARSALGPADAPSTRNDPRAAVEIPASFEWGDGRQGALLSSLSVRGGFLESLRLPEVGSTLALAFPVEDIAIETRAQVLYQTWGDTGAEATGFGVRFGELSPEASEAIEALIESRSVRCLA